MPDSTLADLQRSNADLQRELADLRRKLDERTTERDEGLQRETATAEIKRELRRRHDIRIRSGQKDDFEIYTQEEFRKQFGEVRHVGMSPPVSSDDPLDTDADARERSCGARAHVRLRALPEGEERGALGLGQATWPSAFFRSTVLRQ